MSGRALVEKWPYIVFADPAMKALCVELWGGADGGTAALNTRVNNVKVTGVNGELTYKQAASVMSIAGNQFINNTTITSFDELQYFTGLTAIDNYAFRGCSALVSIAIPSSLTSIGINAFYSCSNLAAVHISDLGAWCNISHNSSYTPLAYSHHLYLNGEEIKDLVIPNTTTTIKAYAFSDCSSFTSVTIPNTVISIGKSAFYGCSGLTSAVMSDSITSIGNSAFYNCNGLTSIIIPKKVTSTGDYTFYGCSSLVSIIISENVTSIGNYAFYNCSGLTSIEIPNSVTSIGTYAFDYCRGLASITIPNSVTSIGDTAFRNCSGLTSVTVLAVTPPTLGNNAFSYNKAGRKIYVPSESVEAYKTAAKWSDYAADIEAIPTT